MSKGTGSSNKLTVTLFSSLCFLAVVPLAKATSSPEQQPEPISLDPPSRDRNHYPPVGAYTAGVRMGASGSKSDSNWKALHGKGAEKDIAVFGAGCYWGTEAYFVKKFGDAKSGGALEATAVGFMGPQGAWANPTYSQVMQLPFYPQTDIIAEPRARLVVIRSYRMYVFSIMTVSRRGILQHK